MRAKIINVLRITAYSVYLLSCVARELIRPDERFGGK